MEALKKYEFTGETERFGSLVLNRIRAVRDFGNVKKGDVGGWVESENNLSHEGECWIYSSYVAGLPCCMGNAKVIGNAKVGGHAMVMENAQVDGDAIVAGSSIVRGNAKLGGNAKVDGKKTIK